MATATSRRLTSRASSSSGGVTGGTVEPGAARRSAGAGAAPRAGGATAMAGRATMSALRFGVARRDGQLALSLMRHSGREARQGRDAIAEIESRIVAHREHELTVRAGRHADRANALDAGEVALEARYAGDADETGHDDACRSDLARGGG